MNMNIKERFCVSETAWLNSIYILHPLNSLLSYCIRSTPYTPFPPSIFQIFRHKFNSPLRQWNKNYYYFLLIFHNFVLVSNWMDGNFSILVPKYFFLEEKRKRNFFISFSRKWNVNLYLIESWEEFFFAFALHCWFR